MTINDYCTSVEATAMLPDLDLSGQAVNGQSFTTIFTTIATYASRDIDTLTGRKPGAYYVNADVTRYPTYGKTNAVDPFSERLGGGGDGNLWIGELAAAPTTVQVSLTGSLTSYVTYSSTDYICGPFDALDDGRPYEWLMLDLINGSQAAWSNMPKGNKITGKFGYSTTPPGDVKMATIIQTARWFQRGKQAFQDKINIINDVSALGYLDKLDDDIERMVIHYKRQAI